MVLHFHEWLLEQARLLEEGLRQNVMSNDSRVNLDSDSFLQSQKAGTKHWVINNAVQFLRDSIVLPTEGQQLKGITPKLRTSNMPNPMKYSTFAITGIDGNNVHMKRNTTDTYVQGKEKMTGLSGLRDVTDSFEQLNLGNGGKDRYYINIFGGGQGHSKTADVLYKTYMQLTKAQASGGADLHVLNVLGGPDKGQDNVKNALNRGAKDTKDQMWLDFAKRIEHGENITAVLKQALRDEETNASLADNPRFVQKLKMMGAGIVLDQMKWTGALGQLTPEEAAHLRGVRQIDDLVAKGQSQVLDGNPQVDAILKNPNTPVIAKVLSLKHLQSYLDKHSGGDLIQKIHQMPQPQQVQPKSNPLEDLMNQQRQAAANSRNPMAAMQTPLPTTKAESVRWQGVKLLGESTRHYKTY